MPVFITLCLSCWKDTQLGFKLLETSYSLNLSVIVCVSDGMCVHVYMCCMCAYVYMCVPVCVYVCLWCYYWKTQHGEKNICCSFANIPQY